MRSGEEQEKANSKGGECRWQGRKGHGIPGRGAGSACREQSGVTADGTGFPFGARKML